MDRIKTSDLEAVVRVINKTTESPETPYTRMEDGKVKTNIGNYHLDWAYGGVKLVRMSSDGGGISDVLRCGYTTKRDLYNLMQAYLTGLQSETRAF